MNNIKEKVAAGLRAVKKTPDAFVFMGDQDWVYDEQFILGIPVFHTLDISFISPFADYDCPFMPVWMLESDSHNLDIHRFITAYNEY